MIPYRFLCALLLFDAFYIVCIHADDQSRIAESKQSSSQYDSNNVSNVEPGSYMIKVALAILVWMLLCIVLMSGRYWFYDRKIQRCKRLEAKMNQIMTIHNLLMSTPANIMQCNDNSLPINAIILSTNESHINPSIAIPCMDPPPYTQCIEAMLNNNVVQNRRS